MLSLVLAWLGAAAFAGSLALFLLLYFLTYGVPAAGPAGLGNTLAPVAIDVALFTAFALHHSLFARPRIKTLVGARVSPALERTFYTWVASGLFVIVCWAWRPVPGVLYVLPAPWHWFGIAAQAAGIIITILGSRSLDVLELSGVRQVMRARGDAPRRTNAELQTRGVYAIVRHPLYFGWALFVFGAPHMTATRFTFAVVSTLYLAIAIPFEERALAETFGPRYDAYRKSVRWRMLPALY